MTLSELRNLDPGNIGGWPFAVRAILVLLLCAVVLGLGWYLDTQNMIAELEKAEEKEITLRETFENKQRKAANLEPLKLQLAEMKQSFGAMLRLLPDRTEIEGLLVDISQSGLAAGLEFELFKPQAEQPAEFYAIQPIAITVTGSYHEVGEFISAVAALPRIVTQHNISMQPQKQRSEDQAGPIDAETPLRMQMVARTYRYLDEDEIAAAAAANKEKGKKRKRKKRR